MNSSARNFLDVYTPTAHNGTMRLAALGSFALLAVLSIPARAQQRPFRADPACTRVTVSAVPHPTVPRSFAIRVENTDRGDFPARLRARVEVQRLENGRWNAASVAGLLLREQCVPLSSECVVLPPRTTITTQVWTGMLGDGQCFCTRCAPAPAGTYRFVVYTCEGCVGTHAFESAPFTLPPMPATR